MDSSLAFLGISLLVITTPGPDTAIAIRSAMAGGLRGGVFTALGVATGLSVWALAAAAVKRRSPGGGEKIHHQDTKAPRHEVE